MTTRTYFNKLAKSFENSVLEHLEYIDIKYQIVKEMNKQYDISAENIKYHIEDGTLFFRLCGIKQLDDEYTIWIRVPLVNASGGSDCTKSTKSTKSSYDCSKILIENDEEFSKLRNSFDNIVHRVLNN